jgi:hypothetical protein
LRHDAGGGPFGAAGDPALAGRYFMVGEMEVGSELRLYADGQFGFAPACGAIDQ